MPQKKFLIPIILLQIIPIIIFPLETITAGISVFGIVFLIYALLGFGLWRGRNWALSMSIFLQGFNIIIRMMMLFPHAVDVKNSGWDISYILMAIISMAISGWFLVRLDKPDIRSIIVG